MIFDVKGRLSEFYISRTKDQLRVMSRFLPLWTNSFEVWSFTSEVCIMKSKEVVIMEVWRLNSGFRRYKSEVLTHEVWYIYIYCIEGNTLRKCKWRSLCSIQSHRFSAWQWVRHTSIGLDRLFHCKSWRWQAILLWNIPFSFRTWFIEITHLVTGGELYNGLAI